MDDADAREQGADSRSGTRRAVGIVGAGMAGVSLAWLLDGACDVVLLETRDAIGGNVRSVEIDIDGHPIVVDMGAQYFHPGPYPVYTALLQHLGLHTPEAPGGATHAFPASITVTAEHESLPRFVSPVPPDRRWPYFAPWNLAGLGAFGLGFIAASARERLNASWEVTLDEWLPTLALKRDQWEGILLPWAASLFSGTIDDARGLSARAAMIFAAKALPPNPFDQLHYHVVREGMIRVLTDLLGQCSTVETHTSAQVLSISREADGRFQLQRAGGPPVLVDDLVLAASGPSTKALLAALPGAEAQRDAIGGIAFHQASLALHTDPAYAASAPAHRSFFNCDVRGHVCEGSMWLASVVDGPPAATATLWKSWITHRAAPQQMLHAVDFAHMLPTPATLHAQAAVDRLQGAGGVWFAGGYLHPYDAQETALLSAMRVAQGLNVRSDRLQVLSAASSD